MKTFYQENKIFILLMGVVLVCLIIITCLLLVYFYKGEDKDVYGNRLDGIKEVEITKERWTEMETLAKEYKKVTDVSYILTGKIIYWTFVFEEGSDVTECQGIASQILDNFSDEEKAFYDFQFVVKENKKDGFIVSGAKSKGKPTISWNNNRVVEEEPKEEEEE